MTTIKFRTQNILYLIFISVLFIYPFLAMKDSFYYSNGFDSFTMFVAALIILIYNYTLIYLIRKRNLDNTRMIKDRVENEIKIIANKDNVIAEKDLEIKALRAQLKGDNDKRYQEGIHQGKMQGARGKTEEIAKAYNLGIAKGIKQVEDELRQMMKEKENEAKGQKDIDLLDLID